jgi:hypothetical protein
MRAVDIWTKVSSISVQLQSTTDPERRLAFENLRDLWISLANEAASGAACPAHECRRLLAIEELISDLPMVGSVH